MNEANKENSDAGGGSHSGLFHRKCSVTSKTQMLYFIAGRFK